MKDEAAFNELKRVERECFMVNRTPTTNKAWTCALSRDGEISRSGRTQNATEEAPSGETAERGVLGLNHTEI